MKIYVGERNPTVYGSSSQHDFRSSCLGIVLSQAQPNPMRAFFIHQMLTVLSPTFQTGQNPKEWLNAFSAHGVQK